jgi:hypothetical protein
VTSATVTYITGDQVPEDVKASSNDQFPSTARVAKINYTYRNDGQQTLSAAPEKVFDTLGREYTGNDPLLTSDDSGTVVPGLQGRGTAYAVVAPDTRVAAIGFEAADSSGVVNPGFGYVQHHTTGG